jgi:hypothetical protein
MFLEADVREALPLIRTPTLIMHRRGDAGGQLPRRALAGRTDRGQPLRRAGRASITFPGSARGGIEAMDEVEEFPHRGSAGAGSGAGARHVLFTDIVDSTQLAGEMGDPSLARAAERHQELTRAQLTRFEGAR